MVSVTPFGIVKTTPFGTVTFPSAVASPVIVQVELTVQSPEAGGEHEENPSKICTMLRTESDTIILSLESVVTPRRLKNERPPPSVPSKLSRNDPAESKICTMLRPESTTCH